MAFISKTFLKCDRCGGAQEAPAAGWLALGGDRHLCPACAAEYLRKKWHMERELMRLAGAKTVEVEI